MTSFMLCASGAAVGFVSLLPRNLAVMLVLQAVALALVAAGWVAWFKMSGPAGTQVRPYSGVAAAGPGCSPAPVPRNPRSALRDPSRVTHPRLGRFEVES